MWIRWGVKLVFQKFNSLFWLFWNISEEPEVEPEPKSCEHVTLPCMFPGCEDLACKDFCAKDKNYRQCGILRGAEVDKKCCECNLCGYDSEETTGKFTHFSISFSDFEILQKIL